MSSKLSYEEYVHLGKQSYREQRYEAAVTHFQKALELARNFDLDVLDCLASASNKLGNVDVALKYGKQMIQNAPTTARGYLRVGRILQSKPDSKSKELAIYERGLKNVKSGNAQSSLLETARSKLYRELNPPASYDPLLVLPIEMVQIIYGYMEFHDLVRSLRVCKSWRSYLTGQPWLWQHIDISQSKVSAQKRLPAKSLQSWAKWSHFGIRSANLGAFAHRQSVVALAIKCTSLASIIFGQESVIDPEVIMAVLKHAKSLRTLTCLQSIIGDNSFAGIMAHTLNLENLELHVNTESLTSMAELEPLFSSMASLQRLSFNGLQHRPQAVWLGVDQGTLCTNVTLQELSLTNIEIRSVMGNLCILELDKLQNLKRLCLRNARLRDYVRLPSSLESLVCDGVRTAKLLLEPRRVAWFSKLRHIEMTRCYQTLDTIEHLLAMPLPDGDERHCDFEAEEFQSIETLKIDALQFDEQPVMDALFRIDLAPIFRHPRVAKLKVLSVDAVEFDDQDIVIMNEHLRTLEVVRLRNVEVTGVGVRTLVKGQKHLAVLVLDNCTSMHPDAVQWARLQGVKVVNNFKLLPRGTGAGKALRWL